MTPDPNPTSVPDSEPSVPASESGTGTEVPPRPLIDIRSLPLRPDAPLQLRLAPGQRLGLLGPRGAGKTALIRALLGIEPLRGDVAVFGLDPRRAGPRIRAAVGYVPARLGYPDGATALSLERLTGSFHARWPARRFYKLLDGLAVPARTRVERLTPALRARLALALAVTPAPRLLVVDPPEDLDAAGRRDLWRAVERERGEAACLLASAEPREVAPQLDSAAVLVDRALVAAGPLPELIGSAPDLEQAYLALLEAA